MVIDMFDGLRAPTQAEICPTRSPRAGEGQVLWCSIRDVQQIKDVDDLVTSIAVMIQRASAMSPSRESACPVG